MTRDRFADTHSIPIAIRYNEHEFENPDFNVRSLRGNAVLRWEYRPGSTLFLVWQKERSGSAPIGDFDFNRDREKLFHAAPSNTFLVKVSYWLGR